MKNSKTVPPTPPTDDQYAQKINKKRNSVEVVHPHPNLNTRQNSRDLIAQSQKSSPKQRRVSPTALKPTPVSQSLNKSQRSDGKKQPN